MCSIQDEEDYEKGILNIATSDIPEFTDSSYVTSYGGIELVCMQENECVTIQFQYKGLYYLIRSYDCVQTDALSVAKHMIDGRNLEG